MFRQIARDARGSGANCTGDDMDVQPCDLAPCGCVVNGTLYDFGQNITEMSTRCEYWFEIQNGVEIPEQFLE